VATADPQGRVGDAGAAESYRAVGLDSDAATRAFRLGRLSALET
jgi:hypothetical protein